MIFNKIINRDIEDLFESYITFKEYKNEKKCNIYYSNRNGG